MNKSLLTLFAVPFLSSAAFGQFLNTGFEAGSGDDATGWTRFGNAYAQGANARTDQRSAKLFGNFSGGFNVTGIFQEIAFTPTSGVTASVYGYNPSTDAVDPANTAIMKLIYRDAAGNDLAANEASLNTAASAYDSWQLLTASLGAAPAGTAKISVFLLYLQPEFGGGAAFFDDVSVQVSPVPEPATFAVLGLGLIPVLRRRRR